MRLLRDIAQQARFAAMLPQAVTERQALAQAIDAANAPTPINHTPVRNGRCSAVCEICNKQSRPVQADCDGEPNLWDMARGWSTAPFPADCRHDDGSVGSTFTCPSCNARLRNGETLQLRRGGLLREVQ